MTKDTTFCVCDFILVMLLIIDKVSDDFYCLYMARCLLLIQNLLSHNSTLFLSTSLSHYLSSLSLWCFSVTDFQTTLQLNLCTYNKTFPTINLFLAFTYFISISPRLPTQMQYRSVSVSTFHMFITQQCLGWF